MYRVPTLSGKYDTGAPIDKGRSSADNSRVLRRLTFLLFLLGIGALAQTPTSMVVTTQWLAARLDRPELVIVYVSPDRKQYDAGHIPGARYLALGDIVDSTSKVANELPSVEKLKRAFESVGVGDSARVILYSDNANLYAARAWWTLDYLGHADIAALLDGSFEKWREEKHPVTTDVPGAIHATFTPRLHPEVLVTAPVVADASWITRNSSPRSLNLVDARPPEQFTGAEAGEDVTRPGHIPGAINLYWVKTLESKQDPQLLPVPDLRKIFREAGVSGTRVITYCRSGMQSSFLYFVARFLGYNVSMYDGSYLDWSNYTTNTVEKQASEQ